MSVILLEFHSLKVIPGVITRIQKVLEHIIGQIPWITRNFPAGKPIRKILTGYLEKCNVWCMGRKENIMERERARARTRAHTQM